MPRYYYEKLRVACLHPVDFAPHEMRQAVNHLKSIDNSGFAGLMVETSTTVGHYKLRAKVLLSLEEIIGKTPSEVWAMFDEGVDADRESLAKRDGSL